MTVPKPLHLVEYEPVTYKNINNNNNNDNTVDIFVIVVTYNGYWMSHHIRHHNNIGSEKWFCTHRIIMVLWIGNKTIWYLFNVYFPMSPVPCLILWSNFIHFSRSIIWTIGTHIHLCPSHRMCNVYDMRYTVFLLRNILIWDKDILT